MNGANDVDHAVDRVVGRYRARTGSSCASNAATVELVSPYAARDRRAVEKATHQSLHAPHSIIARPSSPPVLQTQYSSTSFFLLAFPRGFLSAATVAGLDDSAASTAATSLDCAFARAMSLSKCSASSARCDLFRVRVGLAAVAELSAGASGRICGVSLESSMVMDEV